MGSLQVRHQSWAHNLTFTSKYVITCYLADIIQPILNVLQTPWLENSCCGLLQLITQIYIFHPPKSLHNHTQNDHSVSSTLVKSLDYLVIFIRYLYFIPTAK